MLKYSYSNIVLLGYSYGNRMFTKIVNQKDFELRKLIEESGAFMKHRNNFIGLIKVKVKVKKEMKPSGFHIKIHVPD